MARKGKKSPIWEFYSIGEDSKFAVCSVCGQKVSRGGTSTKTFNTSNLVSHLKTQHHVVYRDYEKQKQKSLEAQEDQPTTSAKAKQLTIKEPSEATASCFLHHSNQCYVIFISNSGVSTVLHSKRVDFL